MAGQLLQSRTIAYLKACKIVAIAVKIYQLRAIAHIKTCKLVAIAVQIYQFRVIAQVKTCKLVGVAEQLSQCCILAHIKALQLVGGAVQRVQCREVFNTCEVGDSHFINIDLRHRCNFLSRQDIIIGCVKLLVNIGSENLIREVCFVYRNAELDRTTNSFITVFAVSVICVGYCYRECIRNDHTVLYLTAGKVRNIRFNDTIFAETYRFVSCENCVKR